MFLTTSITIYKNLSEQTQRWLQLRFMGSNSLLHAGTHRRFSPGRVVPSQVNVLKDVFTTLTVLLLSRIVEMTDEVLGVPYEFKKYDLMAGENMKVKDAVDVY